MVVFAVYDARVFSLVGSLNLRDAFLLVGVLADMLVLANILQKLFLQANKRPNVKWKGEGGFIPMKCRAMIQFSSLFFNTHSK